jgi:hypothetical protein
MASTTTAVTAATTTTREATTTTIRRKRQNFSIFLFLVFFLTLTNRSVSGQGPTQQLSDDGSSPDPIFASHSLSLNNVGLDENNANEHKDIEPTLQGPNVCTKQET